MNEGNCNAGPLAEGATEQIGGIFHKA